MKITLFQIIFVLAFSAVSFAQVTTHIKNAVATYAADPDLRDAKISVVIHDLNRDKTVAAQGPSVSVAPASTLKVITTAAALKELGPDFQFATHLSYTGGIERGVLKGDLLITGGGDPSLGSGYLEEEQQFKALIKEWVEATQKLGISAIEGGIVADASLFGPNGVPPSWVHKDLGNYYAAGSYGINVHDNLYYLRFKQGAKKGDATSVLNMAPKVPNFTMENRVQTGAPGSGDQAYIYSSAFQTNGYVNGTIPPGSGTFAIKGSLPDPAAFLVYHFNNALEKAGIVSLEGGTSRYDKHQHSEATQFHTTLSPPLIQLVHITNRESVNLYAECIGKTMAQGSSVFPLQRFWEHTGIDASSLHIADYSGLSQENSVSGRFMVDALRTIYGDEMWYEQVRNSLSIAGVDGTLKHMFKASAAKGNVYAKSGLIGGVRCYIGYMYLPNNEIYAFAVLAQGFACSSREMSKKFEGLIDAIYQGQ